MAKELSVSTRMSFIDALLVLAVGVAGGLASQDGGVGILCAITAGVGFGVWRCVRILAHLLELKQAEFFDHDTP